MTHIEITTYENTHITLAHIPVQLSREQADIVCRGLDKIGKMGIDLDLYYGAEDTFGRYNNVKGRHVEDGNGVLQKMRSQLVDGLRFFGIPVSGDFGAWTPHVSKPDPSIQPWHFLHIRPMLVLVQKPNRVEVTWG